MTYLQAIDYIHSVVWKGSRPGLSRITELLARLGNPEDGMQFVHIAGTNGKGSTSAMTEGVLRAAGYKTGLFVSPYIKHFNERICFCGKPIEDEALADVTARVKPHADAMEDAPTEFELITAIGLLYFKEMNCDVVVLEAGMGGRLDSTNIIKSPLATVITGIALDHTEYLGDTVEKIATEKAGIIKKGAPMIWGGYDKSARNVIENAAKAAGVPFLAAEDTPLTVGSFSLDGTTISYGEQRDLHLALLGSYQPQNAATVLTLIKALRQRGLEIPEAAVREGLSHVSWRGRFEKLSSDPLIISDGAHNPEGIAAAKQSLVTYFGESKVLMLTGVMADKDYPAMAASLAPHAAEVFTLTPSNPRSLSADRYAEVFRALGIPATGHLTVGEAVAAAVAAARARHLPLVCLGSLYMYAEVTDEMERQGII